MTRSDHPLPLLPLVLAGLPQSLRRALIQEGIPHCGFEPGKQAGRFVLFDSTRRAHPLLGPRQIGIDIHALRSHFRVDPFAALDDERARRCSWQIGSWTVSEEVAGVDKRAIRQRLLAQLRTTIEAAGGVWVRVAPFPYPYRSAFNFRLDYDTYEPEDVATVERLTRGWEEAFSHYVCASSYAGHPEALSWLRDRDVGSHGYWHHTYVDRDENLKNIARGVETLRSLGLEPSGFVSPMGRFNRGLLEALAELQIGHSSEFGLAYDELPFFPSGAGVLQIPVHPICLGIFLEAAERADASPETAAEACREYFQSIAAAKYQAGEPVFLYGHPDGRLGRYPRVPEGVLETVSGFAAVWKTTMTQFAEWWRARSNVRLRVYREADHYRVVTDGLPQGFRCGLEYWRGEHVAPMALDAGEMRFEPTSVVFQRRPARRVTPLVRFDRPEGLRTNVLRLLDWEKVTPVEAIGRRNWRGWLKHVLRRIKT